MNTNKDLPYRLGVGAVLLNTRGLVLVAKRIDTPGEAWQMPQGGIDKDENPERAVMRELKEEVGTDNAEIIAASDGWLHYDLPKKLRRTLWKGRFRGQKQKWYAMRYLGTDDEIDLQADKHPEFSHWRWVALDQVVDLIVPFKRDLYQQIVTEFSAVAQNLVDKGA